MAIRPEHSWTPEYALFLARNALREHLPAALAVRNSVDLARPVPIYGPAGMPMPVYVGGVPHGELAVDSRTPSVYLRYRTMNVENRDAEGTLLATYQIQATVLLSEGAAGTADPDQFVAQLLGYQSAIAYVLCTVWPDRNRGTACLAGVQSCELARHDDPIVAQDPASAVWLRAASTVVEGTQRILNYWEV